MQCSWARWLWEFVGCVEQAQRCARHSQRHVMDRLESHTGTQVARMHTHSVGDSSNRPENASAMPNLPARDSKPHIRSQNGPGTKQMRRTHAHMHWALQLGNLNEPANMSVTQDILARSAISCTEGPNRLESPTDACTRMQSVADDSRRPTDNLERVRRSQNGCKKSSLPAKSRKTHPEKPKQLRNRVSASSGRTHA